MSKDEKGEEKEKKKGEERKIPKKMHRSQFWFGVSHDQALFCETYFSLHITPRHFFYPAVWLRGAQHPLYATKRKPEMHLLAKRCKEKDVGPRKTPPWFFELLVKPLV